MASHYTLKDVLRELMAAEGGEPGESAAQQVAWRRAEAALRARPGRRQVHVVLVPNEPGDYDVYVAHDRAALRQLRARVEDKINADMPAVYRRANPDGIAEVGVNYFVFSRPVLKKVARLPRRNA